LEKIIQLNIGPEAKIFIIKILVFLPYGRSSANLTSFHMRRMVRIEVEMSASVGEFSGEFGG
jgi:hypothetical protein